MAEFRVLPQQELDARNDRGGARPECGLFQSCLYEGSTSALRCVGEAHRALAQPALSHFAAWVTGGCWQPGMLVEVRRLHSLLQPRKSLSALRHG